MNLEAVPIRAELVANITIELDRIVVLSAADLVRGTLIKLQNTTVN